MVAPTAAPAPRPPNAAWSFLLEHLATVDAILAAGHGLDVARQYVWEARVLAAGLTDTPPPDGPNPATIKVPGKPVAPCRHLRVIAPGSSEGQCRLGHRW